MSARVFVALCASLAFTGAGAETVLRIGGTGSALRTAAALTHAYADVQADVRPNVVGNLGTGGALKALRAGVLDVAIAARNIDNGEARSGLIAFRLSRTPLVLATHSGVPLRGITLEQAMKLYGGEQDIWPGGGRVRPILRPMSDSDTAILRAISPGFNVAVLRAHARKGLYTAIMDEDSIAAIAATPGAIGTTTLAMLTTDPRKVNVLALDGVMPTPEALKDGLYQLHKTFYLVVRSSAGPQVRQFLTFAFSERGRDILLRHGQLPVHAGDPASP